jgi:hypothetical protein
MKIAGIHLFSFSASSPKVPGFTAGAYTNPERGGVILVK